MSAAALRALHVPGDPLILPNAWDAGTARLVEQAGFPAVATTSSVPLGVTRPATLRAARSCRCTGIDCTVTLSTMRSNACRHSGGGSSRSAPR